MKRRTQMYVLGGLLLLLAVIWLSQLSSSPQLAAVFGRQEAIKLMDVDNPSLRMDLLERIRKTEYAGTYRNIFDFKMPPPAVKKPEPVALPADTGPPQPPPLNLPFRFYGIVTDPKSGKQRACFTNGEDVFIVTEGEILQNRFRLLRIGASNAEWEELQTGRRATLPLEQPVGPGAPGGN